jgi:glycine/D-amino acid oxidase-like deaminating enzyme
MQLQKDIVILGGGIAGLWLLHRLRKAGYDAVLLEKSALGNGQSIASQGMIHGGLKYALGGSLTGASEVIAEMPAYWQRCLRGDGEVDLRGTQLLSDAYYMWPSHSLRSRLTAFLGSKVVSSKVTAVAPAELPTFFQGHIDGPLYRLHDIVLDVPSLLHTLGDKARDYIHRVDCSAQRVVRDTEGNIQHIQLPDGRTLSAKLFVCTAGEGNAELLEQLTSQQLTSQQLTPRHLAPQKVAMQKRPLQMVVVKNHLPNPVYVHCVGEDFSATPELTITTHPCQDGSVAWYLGGELAESGAALDQATQIKRAQDKLTRLFPWCDFTAARWHSFYINRAEAQQPDNKRPERDSALQVGNVLYGWPTKLTLAPSLADTVLAKIQALQLLPAPRPTAPITGLAYPGIATPPWDQL